VIVVVGNPASRPGSPDRPGGLAGRIAVAAAGRGAGVQLVGRVGDDPAGDTLVLGLATAGVGHVALLRDPARATPAEPEPPADLDADAADADADPPDRVAEASPPRPALDAADVELGLRYITSFDVLVVADADDRAVVDVAAEAAQYVGAHLVVVAHAGGGDWPAGATIVEHGRDEPADALADVVGVYAAGLDAGTTPDAAMAAARTVVADA
jgi:hypothetical protein